MTVDKLSFIFSHAVTVLWLCVSKKGLDAASWCIRPGEVSGMVFEVCFNTERDSVGWGRRGRVKRAGQSLRLEGLVSAHSGIKAGSPTPAVCC